MATPKQPRQGKRSGESHFHPVGRAEAHEAIQNLILAIISSAEEISKMDQGRTQLHSAAAEDRFFHELLDFFPYSLYLLAYLHFITRLSFSCDRGPKFSKFFQLDPLRRKLGFSYDFLPHVFFKKIKIPLFLLSSYSLDLPPPLPESHPPPPSTDTPPLPPPPPLPYYCLKRVPCFWFTSIVFICNCSWTPTKTIIHFCSE